MMRRVLTIPKGTVMRVEDGSASSDDLTPIAISSEFEVVRTGWFGDRWVEVLDHSPGAVVMDRITDNAPLLRNHRMDQQIGAIRNVTLGADRVLRGEMKFSRNPGGVEARTDVEDGILDKVSVGYLILEAVLERQDKETNTDYYRITKWEPVEASLVGTPADPTVGVGRSVSEATYPAMVRSSLVPAPKAKENTVNGASSTAAPGGAEDLEARHTEVRIAASKEERDRASAIMTLANEHGLSERAGEWIGSGRQLADVQRDILGALKERMAKPIAQKPIVDLSDAEQKRYSFARAIACQAGLIPEADAAFEREVSNEIVKHLPATYKVRGGMMVPTRMTRAGLDSGTATKGQELKFTQPGDFIAMLRARTKVVGLGARVLSGLTGPVSFPKQTGAASGSWVTENPGADVADSNLLLGTVTLSAKTYQASTSYSRQLLIAALSASVDAEQVVREDLALVNAIALDLAAIAGTGAGNQPTGIVNTGGIGSVAIGTNGGAPTWDAVVGLETAIAAANADVDTMGYLTTPGVRGKLKRTQQFASANGIPIWQTGAEPLNGYRGEVSTQVPSTTTKGTGTNLHTLIFGVWSMLMIGEWGALEIITDPYRLKKQGMVEVTSLMIADIAIRQAAAFSACKDIDQT
jgi:HK97 family phage major capsid protein/HK97 family phage prohead protease